MISALTPALKKELCKADLLCLDLIVQMCLAQRKKGKKHSAYCFPGQTWICEKLGVSREWVCKCIARLRRLDLVVVIHRRKYKGQWQTNLYRIGTTSYRLIGDARAAVGALVDRVKSGLQIVKKTTVLRLKSTAEGVLRTHSDTSNSDLHEYLDGLVDKFCPREV